MIYQGDIGGLTINTILTKFSKTYETKGESKLPVFEMFCDDKFPIDETLAPLFKRKLISFVSLKLND